MVMTETSGARGAIDIVWRVAVVAVVYAVLFLGFDLLSGSRLTVAGVVIGLVTGAGFALVLLPLARRLPYRMRTRVIALFLPLYWIFTLSNLVEAYFFTTISHVSLTIGAVFLAIPCLAVSLAIAWLFPADPTEDPAPGIWEALRRRPLLSWVWRTLLAGILFAVVLQLAGTAWGPLISRYYHDPAYVAQAHIANPPPPAWVAWTEEGVRGVVFVLVLLPVLAVVRGRDWPAILGVAAYVALIDAALEGWLTMLGNTDFPLGFRIGEGLDLTSDALVRGIFIAALLALPAVVAARRRAAGT
jgi:hypothetical protein